MSQPFCCSSDSCCLRGNLVRTGSGGAGKDGCDKRSKLGEIMGSLWRGKWKPFLLSGWATVIYVIWNRKEGIHLYVRQACGSFERFRENLSLQDQTLTGWSGRDFCGIRESKGKQRRNNLRSLSATAGICVCALEQVLRAQTSYRFRCHFVGNLWNFSSCLLLRLSLAAVVVVPDWRGARKPPFLFASCLISS